MQKAIEIFKNTEWFKVQSLAKQIGVSEPTVRQWIVEGSKGIKLDAIEIGTGSKNHYLIYGHAINKFMHQKRLKENPVTEDTQDDYVIT